MTFMPWRAANRRAEQESSPPPPDTGIMGRDQVARHDRNSMDIPAMTRAISRGASGRAMKLCQTRDNCRVRRPLSWFMSVDRRVETKGCLICRFKGAKTQDADAAARWLRSVETLIGKQIRVEYGGEPITDTLAEEDYLEGT